MSALISKTPLRQVPNVRELLVNENAKTQLAAVAAKHLNPERMMRVVANAIRTTPKLQECEPMSFLGALMQCASLGLEPNTVLGHAYMIPFKNNRKGITEVQVVIGYKGLIDLARRSGHITAIHANIHYSDDELWEYEEGTEARLRHRPGPQDGEKLHAYAIAQFKDGGHAYVVLPWKVVMKIRDGSQNWQTAVKYGKEKEAPWATHEDAMAKKTAIRALSKYLPLSVEFVEAMQADEQHADYRSFAMDPTQGLTIDADTGEIEDGGKPEQIETEAKPEPEKKPEPAARAKKAEPEAKPAAKEQPAAKDGPAAAAEATDAGPPDLEAEPSDKLKNLYDAIIADLTDGGPDAVTDFYATQIEEIRDGSPKLFHQLMEEIDAAREAAHEGAN
jgi:recombination protein RecT